MNYNIELQQPPFSSDTIKEFIDTAAVVFGGISEKALHWRLHHMPDVTLFIARYDGNIVGFKAGYAATDNRYYSWLGGVMADFRNNSVGELLMSRQHQWILDSNFTVVETHVSQANDAMLQLNRKFGFEITGNFLKTGEPYFIMQKPVSLNA